MKTVTVQELEENFDLILADVTENNCQYKIIWVDKEGDKAVMLIPYKEYEILYETYKDWIEETKDNPEDLF